MADKRVTCDCGFLRDRLFWRPRVHSEADVKEREERLVNLLNKQCPKCSGRNPEYADKPGRDGASSAIPPPPETKPKRKEQPATTPAK